MKFQKILLSAAVAAIFAVPMAAQAEFKVSGDVMAFYQDSIEDFSVSGSEVNFDASEGMFSAHAEADFAENGENPTVEEMRIGIKLDGGHQIIIGETDNACDQFDPGVPDQVLSAGTGGGCASTDRNNIVYKGAFGPAEVAASYNPNTGVNADGDTATQMSVGARFAAGPAKINVGYVDDDGTSNMHAGVTATFGEFTLAAEANDNEDADDVAYGIYATYVAAGNTIWAAMDDNSDVTLGYARDLGSNTTFFLEADMLDEAPEGGEDTDFAVGLKHAF